MKNIDWKNKNLELLKKLGDEKRLEEAATLFNCTLNAVRIKYNRLLSKKKTDSSKFKSDIKKVVKDSAVKHKLTKDNPFKIEQVEFTGSRAIPEIVVMLAKQMLNIRANKLDSILIPYNIADSKLAAHNIFQQAKSYIKRNNQTELVYTMKSTFSADVDKKYLSARIWRLK